MEDKKLFLGCQCHSNDHLIKFQYFSPVKEEKLEPLEVYLSVHLIDSKKWYKRLWIGIKYIFGYKETYGHWDEIILGYKELSELQKFTNNVLNPHKS